MLFTYSDIKAHEHTKVKAMTSHLEKWDQEEHMNATFVYRHEGGINLVS